MQNQKRRIVFLGSDLSSISFPCLIALINADRYEILVGLDHHDGTAWQLVKKTWEKHGVRGTLSRIVHRLSVRTKTFLQPFHPNLRNARSIRELAKLHGLECFNCSRVNGAKVRQITKRFDPDLVVVANFSQIIRERFRKIPKFGAINFHPSLLPKYRGPMPFYWILKNGESTSGATVHFIDDGIDTGDIILQQVFAVQPDDTEETLRSRAIEIGAKLLVRSVESVFAGTVKRVVQDDSKACYAEFPNRHSSR